MENEVQSNTPPVQPLPQTPTPVPTPPSTNWPKILLFTIIGLAAVAGSVFVGIQIGKNQTPSQQPIVAQPTASPTQTAVNPSADWKTYDSNLLGYSIKYPQNWLLLDLTEGKQIEIYYQPDKTKSVGEILIEEIDSSAYNREIGSSQDIKDIAIGNTTAKCKTDNIAKTWCYLTSNTKHLSILLVKEKDLEYNKTLDQILSTFFFLDQANNLETYSNNEYRLSFKYPSDFTIEENLVSTSNYLQVVVNKNQDGSFSIKASKNYLPGDVTYFLDTEATGQETIDTRVWKTYYLPDGYGDGPEPSTTPIYALQVEVDGILYTAVFGNQTSITSTQKQVLSTLQF